MAEDERLRRERTPIDDGQPPYEEKVRRYLLGLSPPTEAAEIERGIFEEEHPILEVIEDELVEDYVTGELSESDRSHFEGRFLLNKERVEKIRFSAMLLGRPDVVESLSRRVQDLKLKPAMELALAGELEDSSQGGLQFQSFDESYVERLLAGNFDTQKHFMTYFGTLIRMKVRSRVHSQQAIDDVRQETFARVLAALREGKLRQPGRLGSLVLSVCNNVLMEHHRAETMVGSQTGPGTFSETLSAPQTQEEKIREIISQIPERDRRLLREIFLVGRRREEVCREFGVDPDFLRVLLHRAKQAFEAARLSGAPTRNQQELEEGKAYSFATSDGYFTGMFGTPTETAVVGAKTGLSGIEQNLGSSPARVPHAPASSTKHTGTRIWFAVGIVAMLGAWLCTYSFQHLYQMPPPPARPPMINANPVPYLASAEVAEESPQPSHYSSPPPGYRSYTLTLHGSGFVKHSVVQCNGVEAFTVFISPSELRAYTSDLSESEYEKLRSSEAVVMNPPPVGGASSPVKVNVRKRSAP
jgi:RNA polymerase sigma-70 factor (ECF subfamily)